VDLYLNADSIFYLLYLFQASQPSATAQLGMHELQSWLTSCRKHLNTNMGSYLLRSGRDENLLVGDLYILIEQLKGIQRAAGTTNSFSW